MNKLFCLHCNFGTVYESVRPSICSKCKKYIFEQEIDFYTFFFCCIPQCNIIICSGCYYILSKNNVTNELNGKNMNCFANNFNDLNIVEIEEQNFKILVLWFRRIF